MNWEDLTRELDLWAKNGRVLSLWWRDDDAVDPLPALAALLDLTSSHEVEVGLAVVPVNADDSLAAALAHRVNAVLLQHGYAHHNHAAAGDRAVECGGRRSVDDVLDQLALGRRRLTELFGSRFADILAPPWNRIDASVAQRLSELGFVGLSTFGHRREQFAAPGLAIANAHVDPLDWRTGGRFAGVGKALSGFIGEMRGRRTGESEPEEPLGLLTHHLQHDDATWDFLERFLAVTRAHPAARWLRIAEAFASSEVSSGPAGTRS